MITQADNWFLLWLDLEYDEEDDETERHYGISRVAAWAFQEDRGHMMGVALVVLQTDQGAMLMDAYEHYDKTVLVHGADYSATHPTARWSELYVMFHSKDGEINASAIDAVKKAVGEPAESDEDDED